MNTTQLIHDQGAGLIGSLGLTCAIGAIIAGLILLCYGGAYLFDWLDRRSGSALHVIINHVFANVRRWK